MRDSGITITILGSGTSTGVPVVGCSCPVCSSSSARNKRSRCSVLLSWAGRNILIDTSPDLRRQLLDNDIVQLDAVFYTHSHADHVHGIDDLRIFNLPDGAGIPVYASSTVIERLKRCFGYVFRWKAQGFRPRLRPVVIDGALELFGRQVIPIELLHGDTAVFGYRVGALAYLTDCVGLPEQSWPKLQNLELLIIDGLRYRPHPTHFTVEQAIAVARKLKAARVVLTHLSHDVDYDKHGAELPDNVEFAYDGMQITVHD